MADFSQTQIQDIPLDVRPHEGVSDKSGAIALQGIANAISSIGGIVKQQRAQQQAQMQNTLLNNYRQSLLTIASGVEQGPISSREGRTHARALFSQFVGDNPNLAAEAAKVHKEIMSTPGMGKVITEGTAEEKRRIDMIDDATNKGFIPINADQQTVERGLDLYQESKRLESEWDHQNKQIENILNNRKLSESQREDSLRAIQDQSKRIIGESSEFWYRKSENELQNIVNDFQISRDVEGALQSIKLLRAESLREANSFKAGPGGLEPSYVDNMLEPMFLMFDAYEDVVTGKETAEALKNKLSILEVRSKLTVKGDPEIARMAAVVDIFKEIGLPSVLATEGLNNKLRALLETDVNHNLGDKEIVENLNKFGKDMNVQYDKLSPEAQKNVDNYNNEYLDSIPANESMFTKKGVRAIMDTFNYFASPQFREYRKRGGNLDPEKLAQATIVMEKVLNDSLKQVLEAEMEGKKFSVIGKEGTREFIPATDFIKVDAENGAVKFSVVDPEFLSDRSKFGGRDMSVLLQDAQKHVDYLNQNVAPKLQNMVQGYSNLSMEFDDQKTWDTLVSKILPEGMVPQEDTQEQEPTSGGVVPETPKMPVSELPTATEGVSETIGGFTEDDPDVMEQFKQASGQEKEKILEEPLPVDLAEPDEKDGVLKSVAPEKEEDLDIDDFSIEEESAIEAINRVQGEPLSSSFVDPKTNEEVDQTVLSRYSGRRLPVSIRNNNMGAISITGNINKSWAAKQPGFVGTSPRPKREGGHYAKYATPIHGVAAASRLLELYGRKGTNTPLKIVTKWSADRAAHKGYANTLVKFLKQEGFNVNRNTKLDLADAKVRKAILKAKSAHESGAGIPVYVDSVFERGANYDFGA